MTLTNGVPVYGQPAIRRRSYGSNTLPNTLCRFPVVVTQHSAEPFMPKHRSGHLPHFRRRSDESILQSLVIPLCVIVLEVFADRHAQMPIVDDDQPIEAF